MRMPEAGPFGDTFFDASERAITAALLLNRSCGGCVESVVTFFTHFFLAVFFFVAVFFFAVLRPDSAVIRMLFHLESENMSLSRCHRLRSRSPTTHTHLKLSRKYCDSCGLPLHHSNLVMPSHNEIVGSQSSDMRPPPAETRTPRRLGGLRCGADFRRTLNESRGVTTGKQQSTRQPHPNQSSVWNR